MPGPLIISILSINIGSYPTIWSSPNSETSESEDLFCKILTRELPRPLIIGREALPRPCEAIPGKSLSQIYDDTNHNKEWDYYSITTKKESEKIYFFQDLIDIRSNWSVDDVVLDVDLLVDNMFLKDSTNNDK